MFRLTSIEEAAACIDFKEYLFVDKETSGLYGKIELVQLMQKGWPEALIIRKPDPILLYTKIIRDCSLVAHNASYEISTLQRNIGVYNSIDKKVKNFFLPKDFDCTLLMARATLPALSEYSLDAVMAQALGFDPYRKNGIDKSVYQKSNWSGNLTDNQLLYAAIDVFYMPQVFDYVRPDETNYTYNLDKKFLEKCVKFQTYGIPVDQSLVEEKLEANHHKLKEIGLPVNANSYIQVRKYIESDQSDDLGLIKLSIRGNEKAKDVRDTRKLLKQNNFLGKYNRERVFGIFAPLARSGRATCAAENLQQWPRSLKGVAGYPEDSDRYLGYSDYSQLELRCIAAITGDEFMCRAYKEGKDLHIMTAQILFDVETPTDVQRQIAKTCNFGLLYGCGVNVFMDILIKLASLMLPYEEVQRLVRRWKNLFKQVNSWQEQGIRAFKRGALGSTPLGRAYKADRITDHLNIENQGFGAEVAKLAMHYAHDKLEAINAPIIDFTHDSYKFDTYRDPGVYEEAAKILGDSMLEAWEQSIANTKVPDLPMPVTVRVGKNFGEIEKGIFVYEYKTV